MVSEGLALRLRRSDGMTTILVADDEAPIVELVRFTLEDDDVQILGAYDGLTALELAQATQPDLALLDVQMPRLDGLEVCRRLRRSSDCAAMRIVMLSAGAQVEDRARGLAAGADEYLAKPFSPLALLTLVRSLVPGSPTWPAT
jgi:DNA-binding response OmpR family regulator